jgi:predicted transcriptional regulator of viral defense system
VIAVKYYEGLVNLGCFTRKDVTTLTGNTETAHSIIAAYKKKGLIESVKRDLFVAVSLETKQPIPNRYAIASHIAGDACISHHSAFEYYGLANQVYYEIYVSSWTRFRTFEHGGVTYRHVQPSMDLGVDDRRDGVRVTDIERTVIDGINDFEKIGGLEELLRCLDMIPHLDGAKLIDRLESCGNGFLHQKAGYILEHFKETMDLAESFFAACRGKVPQCNRYLYRELRQEPHVLRKDWRLYAPLDLMTVIRKGSGFVA